MLNQLPCQDNMISKERNYNPKKRNKNNINTSDDKNEKKYHTPTTTQSIISSAHVETSAIIADLLANPNATLTEIGKKYGLTKQAVQQRLARLGISKSNLFSTVVNAFKAKRADLLTLKQAEIYSYMTPDKLNTAPLQALTTSLAILYDKERLERGQSTENIDIQQITASLEEIRKRKEELLAKLDEPGGAATE
jgi:hypothetical protein